MSEQKPVPMIPTIAKAVCPVCKKPSYSPGGVHPQCAAASADAKMRAALKGEAPVAKQPAPKKVWTKVCPKCRRQIPSRRVVCDCGQEFSASKSSSLTVNDSLAPGPQQATTTLSLSRGQAMPTTPVGDATITKQVQNKLAGRGLGPPCRITVATAKGAVTLSGTVQQEAQKGSATQVARTIGGVKQVMNQITVKPREKF